jgi:hypothetical protein
MLSRSIPAYSASSAPLAGTSRLRRFAACTPCPRCTSPPRRPVTGPLLSPSPREFLRPGFQRIGHPLPPDITTVATEQAPPGGFHPREHQLASLYGTCHQVSLHKVRLRHSLRTLCLPVYFPEVERYLHATRAERFTQLLVLVPCPAGGASSTRPNTSLRRHGAWRRTKTTRSVGWQISTKQPTAASDYPPARTRKPSARFPPRAKYELRWRRARFPDRFESRRGPIRLFAGPQGPLG